MVRLEDSTGRGFPTPLIWIIGGSRPGCLGAKSEWEATDCGEQTGNPQADRGRDFPLCVDAIADLADDRMAMVSVGVGFCEKGVSAKPRLSAGTVGKEGQLDRVPKLRDLPAKVRNSRVH